MHIQLDEKTRLTADRFQWILAKPAMEKGEQIWKPDSFFGTLQGALQYYVERSQRLSDAETIGELGVVTENAVARLTAALTVGDEIVQTLEKMRGGECQKKR